MDLQEAADRLEAFGVGAALTARIKQLEAAGTGLEPRELRKLLTREAVGPDLIRAAATVKELAGQVHVVMHAAGLLAALPHILEPNEIVESLSLGAGNAGRAHDLETDRGIAEFTFIDWRGSDTIRQNKLFGDIINLMASRTSKRRIAYVLGLDHPMRFLLGRRSIESVLSRSSRARIRFEELHGDSTYTTVRDYWAYAKDEVEVIDLRELVPSVFGRS
jgi:hypothetical protein